MSRHICPQTHRHSATHTCYNTHGCRCIRCVKAKSRRRRGYDRENNRRAGRDVWVDATGSVRRLRALATLGWPISFIATETGLFHRSLGKVREGSRRQVHLSTHTLIAAVYERFSMRHNLTREGKITRTQATAKGWLPPLGWNDIDTDRHARGIAA